MKTLLIAVLALPALGLLTAGPAEDPSDPPGCGGEPPAACANEVPGCSDEAAECSGEPVECAEDAPGCSGKPMECGDEMTGCSDEAAECAGEPSAFDLACSMPGTLAHCVTNGRDAVVERLAACTARTHEMLARLEALDANGRAALRAAAQAAIKQSAYVSANVELWGVLRAWVNANVLPETLRDAQWTDALAYGDEPFASLVEGQERILLALHDLLEARWDVIVALQLAEPDARGSGHEFLHVDEVLALMDEARSQMATPFFLADTPLSDGFDALGRAAGGDWEAKGTLVQVGYALSDLGVDAGRVQQVGRVDAESGNELAEDLARRSRELSDMAASLSRAVNAYVATGC